MLWATVIFVLLGTSDYIFAGGKGGSVRVRGYIRKDGTYVAPHYRSAPDGNFNNNWSTKGNINPYTGKEGTKISPPARYNTKGTAVYPMANENVGPDSAHDPKPIRIPQNAKVNYFGNGWECKRGYYQKGEACVAVDVPANAKLDYFGHSWECKRGYIRNADSCIAVNVPSNAKLDYFGHGWECERGYFQKGNNCLAIQIPENARLDYFGHGWECKRGYVQKGGSCVPHISR